MWAHAPPIRPTASHPTLREVAVRRRQGPRHKGLAPRPHPPAIFQIAPQSPQSPAPAVLERSECAVGAGRPAPETLPLG